MKKIHFRNTEVVTHNIFTVIGELPAVQFDEFFNSGNRIIDSNKNARIRIKNSVLQFDDFFSIPETEIKFSFTI